MIVCWFAGRYSQSLQHFPSQVPLPNYNPAGRTNWRHFFLCFDIAIDNIVCMVSNQSFVHCFSHVHCFKSNLQSICFKKIMVTPIPAALSWGHCGPRIQTFWNVLEKIGQHRFSLSFFAWFLASACAIMRSVMTLSASACASRRLRSFSLSFCAAFSVALLSSLSSEESVSCFPCFFFVGSFSFLACEAARDASLPFVILDTWQIEEIQRIKNIIMCTSLQQMAGIQVDVRDNRRHKAWPL